MLCGLYYSNIHCFTLRRCTARHGAAWRLVWLFLMLNAVQALILVLMHSSELAVTVWQPCRDCLTISSSGEKWTGYGLWTRSWKWEDKINMVVAWSGWIMRTAMVSLAAKGWFQLVWATAFYSDLTSGCKGSWEYKVSRYTVMSFIRKKTKVACTGKWFM